MSTWMRPARLQGMKRTTGEAVTLVIHPDQPDGPDMSVWEPVEGRRHRDEIIEDLFRHEYEGLLRMAYCIVYDRFTAEDIVMEAFCSLRLHWSGLRRTGSGLAYLRSAVINGSRSRIRQLVRDRARPTWDAPVADDPSSSHAIARDVSDRLARAVRALPARQREVIVCRYYLELGEAETAELLGISAGSVKRHAHRAREVLSARMEADR